MIKYRKVREIDLKDFDKFASCPEAQIQVLKKLLIKTDYQAIKFAEGELSAEEYAPIKQLRKEWRQKINELEANNV